MTIFSRNELYWGTDAQENLKSKHVIVFGLGGVGGFCAEMLARAGVGELTLLDFDKVAPSNINRQVIALNSTVGMDKTTLMELRLKDINPKIKINVIKDFYTESMDEWLLESCAPSPPTPLPLGARGGKIDFVADAIDTMRPKISLLEICAKNNLPIISSFGAGNRINPEELYMCDISEIEEKNSPFISNLIYQLKKNGVSTGIRVVTSREKPFYQEKIKSVESVKTQSGEKIEFTKVTPASTPFVASCAGIFMASYIVRELIK